MNERKTLTLFYFLNKDYQVVIIQVS